VAVPPQANTSCLTTACTSMYSLYDGCSSSYPGSSNQNQTAFLQCLCSDPAYFMSAVSSCGDCDRSIGELSLASEASSQQYFCTAFETTTSTPPTITGTISIVATPTAQVAPSVVSPTATSNSVQMEVSWKVLAGLFWSFFIFVDLL